MKICKGILYRRSSQKNFRNPMCQIIKIFCPLCAMKNIPQIMSLINNQEVPFDMGKTLN